MREHMNGGFGHPAGGAPARTPRASLACAVALLALALLAPEGALAHADRVEASELAAAWQPVAPVLASRCARSSASLRFERSSPSSSGRR